jgi:CYTH domain-containing protein
MSAMRKARLAIVQRQREVQRQRSGYAVWRASAMRIMRREHAMKIERLRRQIIDETGIHIRRDYFWHNLAGLPLMIDCQAGMIFSE